MAAQTSIEIVDRGDYTEHVYSFANGTSYSVWEAKPGFPSPEQYLGDRVDANLDKLRDGIAAFDTLTAAQRWALVKVALRVVLALARLQRGRTEVDG